MEDVDFHYIGESGSTIYRILFHNYDNAMSIKMTEDEKSKFVLKTEEAFFFLVDQGNKHGFNVDGILEIPDFNGSTCFTIAAVCSWNIMMYIIERDIKINSIKIDMENGSTAFNHFDSAIQAMKRGINPYVIDYNGDSGKSLYPLNFVSDEAKRLLSTFSRSIHFSMENIECEQFCPADCPSKFKRFYYKNGPLVEMTDENRIGEGGFGMVYKQEFHGKPMAMKCTPLGGLNWHKRVGEAIENLEDSIFEMRIQTASAGSGVIVPVAYVRQQDQEQDGNGEWIAWNYDIYIYPLYDHNLYELHQNYYEQFYDEILRNFLSQCLTRICSLGKFNFSESIIINFEFYRISLVFQNFERL